MRRVRSDAARRAARAGAAARCTAVPGEMDSGCVLIRNGVRFDRATGAYALGEPPTPLELRRYAEALQQAKRVQVPATVGGVLNAELETVCGRLSPTLFKAVRDVTFERWPLWLLCQLYRNGVAAVDVHFLLDASLEARLQHFTADMNDLFLAPAPSPLALARVMSKLRSDTVVAPRLSPAAAAGALPAKFAATFTFVLEDGARFAAGPASNTLCLTSAVNLAGQCGRYTQLCALQEQAFLLPSDDQRAPYGFRFWDYSRESLLVALMAGRGRGPALAEPAGPRGLRRGVFSMCSHCDGFKESLYFASSPSCSVEQENVWASATVEGGAPRHLSRCPCRSCACCKARTNDRTIKRCAACRNAWYCSERCQRNHWPTHKPHCRSKRDAVAAIHVALTAPPSSD